jgi:hypothetical protein
MEMPMNLSRKIAPPMTEPFDVNKLEEEIAQLQVSSDAAGQGPDAYGKRSGSVNLLPGNDIPSGPSDNPPMPEDTINPAHYRRHPSGIECIEITRHMNFNVGNAVKYLWRYLDKGDPVENLKKAQWYIEDEIVRLRGK